VFTEEDFFIEENGARLDTLPGGVALGEFESLAAAAGLGCDAAEYA